MSSKPKKQGPTAAERAEADVAARDYNRFVTMFAPVEKRRNERIMDGATTEAEGRQLQGMANADIEQAGVALRRTGGYTDGQTRNGMGLEAATDTIRDSKGMGLADATKMMEARANERLISALRTGRGMASTTQQGMAAASSDANSRALNRLDIKTQEGLNRVQAAGNLGAGLGGAYMMHQANKPKSFADLRPEQYQPAIRPGTAQGGQMYLNHNQRQA